MTEIVRISYSANQPDLVTSELENCIRELGANLEIQESQRPQFVNILEWALVAGVAIWITKSFFDGFFSKLGEAAGEKTLSAIKNQFDKSRERNERYYSHNEISAAKSDIKNGTVKSWEEALKGKGKQVSPLEINISGYHIDNRTIEFRLVFTANLSLSEVERSIRILSEERERLFQRAAETEAQNMLPVEINPSANICLIYNPDIDRWETAYEMLNRRRLLR